MSHQKYNGTFTQEWEKNSEQVIHEGALYLVGKWVNSSHQCPKITGPRVISKAKPAKTNVFPQGDTYYQSSGKKNSHLDRHFNIQIADPITPTTVTFMVTLWEYSSRWVPSCANVTQKFKKNNAKNIPPTLYRCKLDLKTFYEGPTYSHVTVKLSK